MTSKKSKKVTPHRTPDTTILAIRKLLKESSMTQHDIAAQLNVSRHTVRRIELGELKPKSEGLARQNNGLIKYERVPPYICPICGYRIKLRPCTYCVANSYIK